MLLLLFCSDLPRVPSNFYSVSCSTTYLFSPNDSNAASDLKNKTGMGREFTGGPTVWTLSFHYKAQGYNSCLGN